MRLRSGLRALILVGTVLDAPLVARGVRTLTREPRVEESVLEGVPMEIVRPAGPGPWPAWLFVNGAHPERRREPVVERLSRGLARAGYVVFVPDVPGLGEGSITRRTLAATAAVTEAALRHRDVRGARVALIGASTGAGLALLTAAQPELARRVSVVAAVAPFADLERMICLATTRAYAENGGFTRYEVTDLHRRVVARSLVAAVADADERRRLLAALDRAEREERDAIAALPHEDEAVEPDTRSILAVLTNEEPERFGELYAALPPDVLALLSSLSPLGSCAGVSAPVEVVVPPSDVYFPPGEALALAEALPNVRLTVTATLDHTRPQLSLARLREFGMFGGFVVRGLDAAAR
jgi:pimeloyl-ACP methyl ester carboxylesterase